MTCNNSSTSSSCSRGGKLRKCSNNSRPSPIASSIRCKLCAVLPLVAILMIAADSPKPRDHHPLRVKVGVSGSDDAASFIRRELRSLSDVLIVTTNEQFAIQIVVSAVHNNADTLIGYALSVVLTGANNIPMIVDMALQYNYVDAKAAQLLHAASRAPVHLLSHRLYLTERGGLRAQCTEIVNHIDTQVFEPQRQSYQQMHDLLAELPVIEPASSATQTNATR